MNNDSGVGAIVGIVLLAAVAHQCSKEPSAVTADWDAQDAATAEVADRAEDAAADAVAGTTYADQGAPYGCTDDCGGHNAGYAWAEQNDLTDPDECGGNSASFVEGCRAYGEAYEEAREEALADAESEPEDQE